MGLLLEDIHLGALNEMFSNELKRVIENIVDVNTDPKKKRKIKIEFEIAPDAENRELCSMKVKVMSVLAPDKELVSVLRVGVDRRSGRVAAEEIVPKQTPLFPEDQPGGKVVTMNGTD
jgi:hypothetical protein